jgi:transposase-like protein
VISELGTNREEALPLPNGCVALAGARQKWTPHDRTDLDDRASAPPWRNPEGGILAECERSGASIAAIAMAHGVNANLVHKWRARAAQRQDTAVTAPNASFVPVPLQAASISSEATQLRIQRQMPSASDRHGQLADGICR